MGSLDRIYPLHPKIISSDLDAGDRAVLDDLVTEEGQQSHAGSQGWWDDPARLTSTPQIWER